MMINDSYRHKGLRSRLVEQLREKGICDETVLTAISIVPRHLFLDSSFLQYAYRDMAFPIGAGQTISQPSTVAFQSSLLNLTANSRVLEIGTGSGYQAAVLCQMGVELYTIERQSELFQHTGRLLPSLGYNRIKMFLGDGFEGLPNLAPFDAIIVTAGAPNIPEKLLLQLKTGGVMVIPIGIKTQIMTRIKRLNNNEFEQEEFGSCAFVPMLEGIEK